MNNKRHTVTKTVEINAPAEQVFDFLDDHRNLVSHMDKPSLMMGGGKVVTEVDDKQGMAIGSHIVMKGSAFGMKLYLDEVITVYKRPTRKEWSTVGDVRLIVIGPYTLGFTLHPMGSTCHLTVAISYELPKSLGGRILGFLLGRMYANWCVNQMIISATKQFNG